MKFYLCNAFSINMLSRGGQDISFVPVHPQAVINLLRNEDWESAIGHEGTASVVSDYLGVHVPARRVNVELNGLSSLIIAQYRGPRLEIGAVDLPDGATIEFWQVYLS